VPILARSRTWWSAGTRVASCPARVIEIHADHSFAIETYPELGDGPSLVRGTWKAVAPMSSSLDRKSRQTSFQYPRTRERGPRRPGSRSIRGWHARRRSEHLVVVQRVERQTVADRDGIALLEECDPSMLRVSFVNFAPAVYHLDRITATRSMWSAPLSLSSSLTTSGLFRTVALYADWSSVHKGTRSR